MEKSKDNLMELVPSIVNSGSNSSCRLDDRQVSLFPEPSGPP